MGIGFVSFSLTHHTRNSLLGLPVITQMEGDETPDSKYTAYTMSEVIAKVYEQVNAGYSEGILLLDEFPCMSPTIIPAMLAFLQTKNIGTHTLPSGWTIVLCGNPPEYNDHSITFDTAIMDRLRTIEVAWDPQVFLNYAREQKFHESVINFLELNTKCIYRLDDNSLVTCRGWENLSHAIRASEQIGVVPDYRTVRQFIKSDEIAEAFTNYYVDKMGLTVEDLITILSGKHKRDLVKRYNDSSSNDKLALTGRLASRMTEDNDSLINDREALNGIREMFRRITSGVGSNSPYKEISDLPLDVMAQCLLCPNANVREIYPELFSLPYVEPEWEEESPVREAMKQMVIDMRERIVNFLPQDACSRPGDRGNREKHISFIDKWIREKESEIKKRWKAAAKQMDNVFKFMRQLDGGERFAERFFYYVNRNPCLLRIASEGESAEYLGYVNQIYGRDAS